MSSLEGMKIIGPDGTRYELKVTSNINPNVEELMNLRGIELGNKIKYLRESKDLSQRQLAVVAGITQVQLCRIERGKVVKPHDSVLKALSQSLI